MKTKFLTFILLISILYSNGQAIESIGIKGGISLSTMTYKYQTVGITEKNDYKVGIYSVLTAEFFKGKYLSLSTDLGFVQKGMKEKIPITTPEFPDGTGEYSFRKFTRNYVSFSPMLKGFYNFNKLTTYAVVGPRMDIDVTYALPPGSTMGSKTHKFIWGLTYGLGAEYKIGKLGILLECLGHPDLTAILDQQSSDSNFGLKVKGNAYILTTGLKYYIH